MAGGEFIEAYDLAQRALVDFPGDLGLRHVAVLILARSGATQRARSCYETFGLDKVIGGHLDSPLKVDIASLDARKDRADGLRRTSAAGRTIRAFFFCDVKGFSQLREPQLPIFEREVLGRFAKVLARYRRRILFRNTWGDGLYVVTSGVEGATGCAIDLLDEMAAFNPEEHGLPAHLRVAPRGACWSGLSATRSGVAAMEFRGISRQPRGDDRAGHARGRGLRDRGFRGGARHSGGQCVRVRVRGSGSCRQRLRYDAHVRGAAQGRSRPSRTAPLGKSSQPYQSFGPWWSHFTKRGWVVS